RLFALWATSGWSFSKEGDLLRGSWGRGVESIGHGMRFLRPLEARHAVVVFVVVARIRNVEQHLRREGAARIQYRHLDPLQVPVYATSATTSLPRTQRD